MRWPTLNNRLLARAYMDGFEDRFHQTVDSTLFLDDDGSAVRLPDEEAARLIAAMRATLIEAEARTPLAGGQAGWAAAGAALGAFVLGAGIGLPGLGCALALPAAVGVLLLGPGLGAMRVDAAWSHGMDRVRAAVAGYERLPADETRTLAPPNHIRPVLQVAGVVVAAMIVGLVFAYVSMPFYARVGLDRSLARAAPLVFFALVILIFASRARDAVTRRRVAQAAVGDAWGESRRPFR